MTEKPSNQKVFNEQLKEAHEDYEKFPQWKKDWYETK